MGFNAERQNSPLRSTAILCTEVIASVLRKSQPVSYIFVYSHKVLADLLERYSVSVPPVTNNIYRSAVPAPNYLPERRSAAFRHHYSPVICYMIDVSGDSVRQSQHALTITLTLNRNSVTLRTCDPSD